MFFLSCALNAAHPSWNRRRNPHQEIDAGPACAPYNHLRMQLGSDVRPQNGLLAEMTLLAEKPRQGVPTSTNALHRGFGFVISSTSLGIIGSLYDEGIGSRSTGKERDAESGNDYMFARYYNSATGRFLSPDWSAKEDPVPYAKLDNPQSLNLYSYVYNNPVGKADPDGHVVGVDDAVEAAAVGVAILGTATVIYLEQPAQQRSMREAASTAVSDIKSTISGWFSKGDKTAPAPADAKPQEPTSSAGGDTAGQRFRPADRAEDAGKKCVYCGRQTTEEPGKDNSRDTDHGHPRSDGGNAEPENRNPSCRTCNRQKGTKTVPQFRQWQEQNPDKVPKSMLFFPDLWRTAPWDERYSDLKIAA